MPRVRRLCVLTSIVVVSLVAAPATASACATANLAPAPGNAAQVRAGVVCVINAQRARFGLGGLMANLALTKAAQGWANRGQFSHGANPGGRIRAAGYSARGFGETLAYHCGAVLTPAQVVTNWLNSAQHRAILLGRSFREVGIGFILRGAGGCAPGILFVGNFGYR